MHATRALAIEDILHPLLGRYLGSPAWLKASAGRVLQVSVNNTNAAARYLKLYNKATAPVVGTDVPVATFALPAVNGINMEFSAGLAFPLGLGIGLTTGSADNNSTGVTAGESIVTLSYT